MLKDTFQDRQYIIQVAFLIGAAVLLLRSLHLQLLDTEFIEKAELVGTYYEKIQPPRGLIYDRNGRLLVQNDPMYDIKVVYNEIENLDTAKLCKLLGINVQTFIENLNKDFSDHRYNKYKPFTFLSRVSALKYATFQENQYQFSGFSAERSNVRNYYYPHGAHALGYLNEVDARQVARSDYYEEGDYIGETGLEKEYEEELRGQFGRKYFTRNNIGRVVESYKDGELDIPAVAGKNMVTTLDIQLQRYGEQLMQNKKGSIVAIEPSTGEILTFISSPTYSPRMLSIHGDRARAFASLQADTLKPLFNRAFNALYPPGSTFKPLMSLIALEEKAIWSGKGIQCFGYYMYKNKRYGCRPHLEPITNMARALKYSCNSYYWQAFRNVIDRKSSPPEGMNDWAAYVRSFGLGTKLGIDIDGEKIGTVPDGNTYNKIYPDFAWQSPTVMSVAIGQGELETTPIQLANMAAVIANRGYYITPHLARGFIENDTTVVAPQPYKKHQALISDSRHYKSVIYGMELVIENTNSMITDVKFCGKTGTVQNPHGEDHSTFIGFAPKDNPTIAIAVYVENSGYGSTYARPIASLLVEKYLKRKVEGEKNSPRKRLEKKMLDTNLIN